MTGWLKLNDSQRKATIDAAAEIGGISPKAIEKDWWVTLALKALFQSAYAGHMIFKGGTSLSKCWKLVARFSEDVDIALDPEIFGMSYIENPSKSYVEKLKRTGCAFTSNELKVELDKQLVALGVPADMIVIAAAVVPEKRPDTDPQVLFIKYPSLYEPSAYLADEVKVEVGVRSLKIPYTQAVVQSLLHELYPNPAYAEIPFLVTAVEPRKTFLEKAMLLHEQFNRPNIINIKTERMSRHLYDLVNLMDTAFGRDALADHDLYNYLVQHRQWYSRISWVNYQSLGHSTLSFLPPPAVLEMYREDYEAMQEKMIYEKAMPFDDVIHQLKILQGRFRIKMYPTELADVIEAAEIRLQSQAAALSEGQPITITVTYPSDPGHSAAGDNNAVTYLITLLSREGRLFFENISIQE
jgi:hypothetical protein